MELDNHNRNSAIKVSIALTTYNGENYIIEQLESIANQSRQPDEVIICDDMSSDNTVRVVNDFIKKKGLSGWTIIENKTNIGWKKNFYQAISYTIGDVIFFSDQDDIWLPDKIEKMTCLMIDNNLDCLYGDKFFMDTTNNINYDRTEKKTFTGKLKIIPFTRGFFDIPFMGCCMCISRKIINIYLRLSFVDDSHDGQCGRLALLLGKVGALDEVVIQYRLHSFNTSGISEAGTFGHSSSDKRMSDITISLKWLQNLLTLADINEAQKNLVKKCIKVQQVRKKYFEGRVSFIYLIPFYPYYPNITSFLGDYAYRNGLNKKMGEIRWKIKKLINR